MIVGVGAWNEVFPRILFFHFFYLHMWDDFNQIQGFNHYNFQTYIFDPDLPSEIWTDISSVCLIIWVPSHLWLSFIQNRMGFFPIDILIQNSESVLKPGESQINKTLTLTGSFYCFSFSIYGIDVT